MHMAAPLSPMSEEIFLPGYLWYLHPCHSHLEKRITFRGGGFTERWKESGEGKSYEYCGEW